MILCICLGTFNINLKKIELNNTPNASGETTQVNLFSAVLLTDDVSNTNR